MTYQGSKNSFKLENVFNLKNRVALVTGGESGIGLMATQLLAVNGAKVYITGRTEEKLQRVAEVYGKDIPGQIIPISADITSKESIKKLVDEISAKESKLHILINNAGIVSSTMDTDRTDPKALQEKLFHNKGSIEDWENVMRTNVTQIFFTSTAFLPLLGKASQDDIDWSSTIVNISSISGIVKTAQHHFAYNTSKAAAVHLTKLLAYEFVASGLKIRVNNIAPAFSLLK